MTTATRGLGTHRRRLFLTAGLGLAMAGLARLAHADPVDLSIIDRTTGQPLQVWRHDGRLFVAGQTGAGYCLRVTNHTAGRVMAVLSVDGVNIISGETAGYDQRGYIYGPYETYQQCGWRKSLNEVAAFSFTALPDSYAAGTGRPADVGVVGMAVFYEKVAPPPPPAATGATPPRPSNRSRAVSADIPPPVMQREVPAAPEPGPPPPAPIMVKPAEKVIAPPPPPRVVSAAPPASQARSATSDAVAAESQRSEKLGTAHGALETSVIRLVDFTRASSNPDFVRQIEYDSYQNLLAAGVISASQHRPHPFPEGGAFVPDPPAYR